MCFCGGNEEVSDLCLLLVEGDLLLSGHVGGGSCEKAPGELRRSRCRDLEDSRSEDGKGWFYRHAMPGWFAKQSRVTHKFGDRAE